MGFFSNLKALGGMIIGFLALFGFWKYNNKVQENEELKSYADMKDKETSAMKETVIVQDKVHQQDIANVQMEKSVVEDEVKITKQSNMRKKKIHKKLDEVVEGQPFDLEA